MATGSVAELEKLATDRFNRVVVAPGRSEDWSLRIRRKSDVVCRLQHVRRVCGKPKDVGYRRLRSSLLPWGAMFWMMVVLMIGLIVALMSTQLVQHDAGLLIRLSRGS